MIGIRRTEGPPSPVPERRDSSSEIKPVPPVESVVSREPDSDSITISKAAYKQLKKKPGSASESLPLLDEPEELTNTSSLSDPYGYTSEGRPISRRDLDCVPDDDFNA